MAAEIQELALIPTPPPTPRKPKQKLSHLHGPVDPPLVDLTLGEVLSLQAEQHGARECLVFPWTGARWTYGELDRQSTLLAAALLETGVGKGDRVGVMAGNCEQYAAVFFGVVRMGAILVILNNTYTSREARYALGFTGECFGLWSIGRMWLTRGRVQGAVYDEEDWTT